MSHVLLWGTRLAPTGLTPRGEPVLLTGSSLAKPDEFISEASEWVITSLVRLCVDRGTPPKSDGGKGFLSLQVPLPTDSHHQTTF